MFHNFLDYLKSEALQFKEKSKVHTYIKSNTDKLQHFNICVCIGAETASVYLASICSVVVTVSVSSVARAHAAQTLNTFFKAHIDSTSKHTNYANIRMITENSNNRLYYKCNKISDTHFTD